MAFKLNHNISALVESKSLIKTVHKNLSQWLPNYKKFSTIQGSENLKDLIYLSSFWLTKWNMHFFLICSQTQTGCNTFFIKYGLTKKNYHGKCQNLCLF